MKFAVSVVLTLIPFFAVAEPLPRFEFDYDTECRNFKRADGDERPAIELYNECFDKKQASYNKIKSYWEFLEPAEQARCLDIMKSQNTQGLSTWGKLVMCIGAQRYLAIHEDPGRAERRKKEQERQEAQQRDERERSLIPKRELQY